jgi:hypothetical protein
MARTGTPAIIKLTRKICKLVTVYGASDLAAKTSPAFQAAVTALVAACVAFEALDDYPAEIDITAPFGPEDL